MNKKLLIIISVVVFLALVGGGYYYWKTQMQKSAAEQAVEDIQKTAEGVAGDVSKGVLPEIDTGAVNPMESAQSANPYDKTNPFSNMKVNPFK